MKILLRHLASGIDGDGTRKETVELATVPHEGEEIHWPERILRVYKTIHFPDVKEGDHVACLYVTEPS